VQLQWELRQTRAAFATLAHMQLCQQHTLTTSMAATLLNGGGGGGGGGPGHSAENALVASIMRRCARHTPCVSRPAALLLVRSLAGCDAASASPRQSLVLPVQRLTAGAVELALCWGRAGSGCDDSPRKVIAPYSVKSVDVSRVPLPFAGCLQSRKKRSVCPG
jgi:hypothetical protein